MLKYMDTNKALTRNEAISIDLNADTEESACGYNINIVGDTSGFIYGSAYMPSGAIILAETIQRELDTKFDLTY